MRRQRSVRELRRIIELSKEFAAALVRPAVHVDFGVPVLVMEGVVMVASLNVPSDASAKVPLIFKDDAHLQRPAPAAGGSVSSNNPAIATAAVPPDNASVVVSAVTVGECDISYSNGAMSAQLHVVVVTPVATEVEFDPMAATFAPLAAPAA